jgi:hypothetical protein
VLPSENTWQKPSRNPEKDYGTACNLGSFRFAGKALSMVTVLSFATTPGAQILELYLDDWFCNLRQSLERQQQVWACTTAGYPVVSFDLAGRLN